MYYDYFKGFLHDERENTYEKIYEEIKDKVSYSTKGRRSCLFALHSLDLLGSGYANKFSCDEVPTIIQDIRTKVELLTGQVYDFVLAHIYLDGDAGIAYHSDAEANDSFVCSVSFGASRKFRLRRIGETKGYDKEFILGDGDVFVMKPTMQSVYKHAIIPEKGVKNPRINLTFRQYEI